MRNALWALGVAAALVAAPLRAETEMPPSVTATISAEQARDLGLEAIRADKPELALAIAQGLLARDKADPFAHFLLATAYMHLDRLPEAQAAGKIAYRYGKTPEQRFQAARLTALVAYNQGRYATAQWWLRRAAHNAPTEERKARSVAEFNSVRAKNPLRLKLQFSVVPSDNVNNGSSGQYNIIDGVPYVGVLSADAQALSGVVSEGSGEASYRFRQTAHSETHVGARLKLRQVDLSAEARAEFADTTVPDFNTQRLEFTLRHVIKARSGGQRFTLDGALGRQWSGNVEPYSYARLSFGHLKALGAKSVLDSALTAERRSIAPGQTRPDHTYSLRSGLTYGLANADTVSAMAYISAYETEIEGRGSTTLGGQVSYTLGRALGPVNVSASLGYQASTFPGYTIATIVVPGGRKDKSVFAEVQMTFSNTSYAGFAPLISLRKQRTQSNVSRFDASETAVTLGLRSTF